MSDQLEQNTVELLHHSYPPPPEQVPLCLAGIAGVQYPHPSPWPEPVEVPDVGSVALVSVPLGLDNSSFDLTPKVM